MGYKFQISTPWYSIKEEGDYPWPCKAEKHRTVKLFTDDVLTEMDDKPGHFMRHTGLGVFNIKLDKESLILHNDTANLQII